MSNSSSLVDRIHPYFQETKQRHLASLKKEKKEKKNKNHKQRGEDEREEDAIMIFEKHQSVVPTVKQVHNNLPAKKRSIQN